MHLNIQNNFFYKNILLFMALFLQTKLTAQSNFACNDTVLKKFLFCQKLVKIPKFFSKTFYSFFNSEFKDSFLGLNFITYNQRFHLKIAHNYEINSSICSLVVNFIDNKKFPKNDRLRIFEKIKKIKEMEKKQISEKRSRPLFRPVIINCFEKNKNFSKKMPELHKKMFIIRTLMHLDARYTGQVVEEDAVIDDAHQQSLNLKCDELVQIVCPDLSDFLTSFFVQLEEIHFPIEDDKNFWALQVERERIEWLSCLEALSYLKEELFNWLENIANTYCHMKNSLRLIQSYRNKALEIESDIFKSDIYHDKDEKTTEIKLKTAYKNMYNLHMSFEKTLSQTTNRKKISQAESFLGLMRENCSSLLNLQLKHINSMNVELQRSHDLTTNDMIVFFLEQGIK